MFARNERNWREKSCVIRESNMVSSSFYWSNFGVGRDAETFAAVLQDFCGMDFCFN